MTKPRTWEQYKPDDNAATLAWKRVRAFREACITLSDVTGNDALQIYGISAYLQGFEDCVSVVYHTRREGTYEQER